jgi:hypothetical protein
MTWTLTGSSWTVRRSSLAASRLRQRHCRHRPGRFLKQGFYQALVFLEKMRFAGEQYDRTTEFNTGKLLTNVVRRCT